MLGGRAYEAVGYHFVVPNLQPTSASFHSHGDVNQSIIGIQNRAELTNNFDLGNIKERTEREGAKIKEIY